MGGKPCGISTRAPQPVTDASEPGGDIGLRRGCRRIRLSRYQNHRGWDAARPAWTRANEADRQRWCWDVALARANIQVRYDPLEQQPFLNVIAIPQPAVVGKPVRFTSTTPTTRASLTMPKMRLFACRIKACSRPHCKSFPSTAGQSAEWVPPAWRRSLLRLTSSTWSSRTTSPMCCGSTTARGTSTRLSPADWTWSRWRPSQSPEAAASARDIERLAYGENTLVLHNIPVQGGAVTVSGGHVPPGDTVLVQGIPIPAGTTTWNFVARQIPGPAVPAAVSQRWKISE